MTATWPSNTAPFSIRLAQLRRTRGVSQLGLAGLAEISQRHVSFLETGRTQPSRAMIGRISAALLLSLREQNALLKSAGFAPLYPDHAPDAAALAPLHSIVEKALRAHEPFPAFAADRAWRPLQATNGAIALWRHLTSAGPQSVPDPKASVIRAGCSSPHYRHAIRNWGEVAGHLEHLVRWELLQGAPPDMRAELEATLEAIEQARPQRAPSHPEPPGAPFLIMRIATPELAVSFVTTIARFGAPHDAGAEDMRIEFYYCLDAASEAAWRSFMDSR